MLEIRSYTFSELSAILGTNKKQDIDRKLQRYGVKFVSNGSRKQRIYEIKEVPDRFKLYCVTELGMSANVDFEKFKYFCYYLFCDENFAAFPMVEMENIMSNDGVGVSRQTISKWLKHLNKLGYIHFEKQSDCLYYAITKTEDNEKHYTEISKEAYCKGWSIYWNNIAEFDSGIAYKKMYKCIGGHPYKHPKIDQNVFYSSEIDKLIELVNESFLE